MIFYINKVIMKTVLQYYLVIPDDFIVLVISFVTIDNGAKATLI